MGLGLRSMVYLGFGANARFSSLSNCALSGIKNQRFFFSFWDLQKSKSSS